MSSLKQDTRKVYWRSMAELGNDPEFQAKLEKEFPAAPMGDVGSFSRRRFMQLMGASMAMASGASCRWEKENILAFTRKPAGHTPGVPKHYATVMELGGVAEGLRVTSYDGRPIKIEGNAEHPVSRGATTAFAQASILELYDPDRSQALTQKGSQGAPPDWDAFAPVLGQVMQAARAQSGQGFVVLSEAASGPTMRRLRDQVMSTLPKGRWLTYEPLSRDNELQGTARAFGQPLRPVMQFEQAKVVASFDEELFVEHPAATKYARDYGRARTPDNGKMSRLYVAESRFSNTGAMADHRLALRSAQVRGLLLAVMAQVAKLGGLGTGTDAQALKNFVPRGYLTQPSTQAYVQALAQDLSDNRGASIVAAGPGQSSEVHQLVHQLNGLLGNIGHTVTYVAAPEGAELSHSNAIAQLTQDMRAGKVDTLIILGGNPAFDAPGDCPFGEALSQVRVSMHLSLYPNETSQLTTWHLPRSHYLESWGDARSWEGTLSLAQPLIDPLYDTRSAIEFVSLMAGDAAHGQALVHETHTGERKAQHDDAHETPFRALLKAGVAAGSAWSTVNVTSQPPVNPTPLTADMLQADVDNGALELTFWPDSHVYDGRFANNGWLQELPDFMSKLTWDNAAFIAPSTARALGVAHETLIELSIGGQKLAMPAYVMPGQAKGSIAVALGYGRTHAGHVAGLQSGNVPTAGFNTFKLRVAAAENFAGTCNVKALGTRYELAITQDHHSLDNLAKKGRDERVPEIVREATLTEFKKDPKFAQKKVEHPPLKSLWQEFEYNGHKWGMAIDLNTCTGCNACVVACQAENNIPVVGKEQVIRGREMHWLRIDRYFSGEDDAPKVVSQPMTCQQCEMAPCESVCPVAATVHSREGLNDMVYNRCVGTRYCSNNCPYKVRRFNFFNYHKTLEQPGNQVTKMVYNPEVTVRARGVMEKCTYCVQRIQNAKILARNARRALEDGEITTACAQACAGDAIVFGDLSDPTSRVSKKHANGRSYAVLEELNTKPRTAYLARVTNPNASLEPSAPSETRQG